MSQQHIKQIRGGTQGSILFLGTNSVITEDSNKLNYDQDQDILNVYSKLRLADGTQQSNYVLISDATGLVSWTSSISNYYYIGDSSTNTNIDWSLGVIQEINLDDDPILTFSNGVLGTHQTLLLKQTQLGIRNVTWPSDVLWDNNLQPQLVKAVVIGGVDTSFETNNFNGVVFSISTQPTVK
jgi:hypothetical protein